MTAMFETDWRNLITEPAHRKVFEALEDPRWEWRTTGALSKASGLEVPEVEALLQDYPSLVRKSLVPGPGGKDIFTLQRRYFERKSVLEKIHSSLSTSSTSTSE